MVKPDYKLQGIGILIIITSHLLFIASFLPGPSWFPYAGFLLFLVGLVIGVHFIVSG